MTLLSLDLSTKATGAAVFVDGKLVHYECIRSKDTDINRRMFYMVTTIGDIIDEYQITSAIIEDVPWTMKSRNVIRTLFILQGMAILTFLHHGVAFEKYQSTHWRQIIGFYVTEHTCENCGATMTLTCGCPYTVCSKCGSTKIKRRVINDREAMKIKAVELVNKLYGFNFNYYARDTAKHVSNDNEAEAICLGLAFLREKGLQVNKL